MQQLIAKRLLDWDIDIYYQDMNTPPWLNWNYNESETRQGINEMKYVEGLYAFLDYLLAHKPQLVINNVAGGGRRLDFEMFKRSISMWSSDANFCPGFHGAVCGVPAGVAQTIGISLWYPKSGYGVVAGGKSAGRAGMRGSSYFVESDFCATDLDSQGRDLGGIGFNFTANRAGFWSAQTELIAEFRAIAPFFEEGDFYPLTRVNATHLVVASMPWMAWQFHRPDHDDGIVQVYSAGGFGQTFQLAPVFLPAARYVLSDWDNPQPLIASGAVIMAKGLRVITNGVGEVKLFKYARLKSGEEASTRSAMQADHPTATGPIQATRTWSLPAEQHGKPATEMTTARKIDVLPPPTIMELAPLDSVVLLLDAAASTSLRTQKSDDDGWNPLTVKYGVVKRPPELLADYGTPTGLCRKENGSCRLSTYVRNYTKAMVSPDCQAFTATITMKLDDDEILQHASEIRTKTNNALSSIRTRGSCQCGSPKLCLPISTPRPQREVLATIDVGPSGYMGNWRTQIDWNVTTILVTGTTNRYGLCGFAPPDDPSCSVDDVALFCHAHAHGVRVVPEVAPSWDPDTAKYGRFLNFSSPPDRAAWVKSAAATMVATGLDGIIYDIEVTNPTFSVPMEQRHGIVKLFEETQSAFHAANPHSLMLSWQSINSSGTTANGFDAAGLAAASDSVAIMAYGKRLTIVVNPIIDASSFYL
jgi:hypothetical protein